MGLERRVSINNLRSTKARGTAFEEARRESAGSIHRCRGNTEYQKPSVHVSPSVSVDDGKLAVPQRVQLVQPQRKDILSF